MSVETPINETENFVTVESDHPEVVDSDNDAQAEESTDQAIDDKADQQDPDEASEDNPSGDDAAAEHNKPKKSRSAQKRIDKVVREREATKRENEALKRQLEELQGKKESDEPSSEDDSNDESDEKGEDDFESYEEYLDYLDGEDKPKTEPASKTELTDGQKTALAVIQEAVAESDVPEDFEAVALDPSVPINGEMLEAIAECDDPIKVMYALGKDKALAADIAGKSAIQVARAIAKLDMSESKAKPSKPASTTKAPDPIVPVGGSDAQQKSIDKMSFAEYEAHQNKIEREKTNW